MIEFPGTNRAPKPQWRKELSERVREIQQRRAAEAAREAEEAARHLAEQPATAEAAAHAIEAQPLGLVPPAEAPPLNPLVAAALKRIERARQQQPRTQAVTRGAHTRGAAATAVARVTEDEQMIEAEQPPVAQPADTPAAPEVRHEAAARAEGAAEQLLLARPELLTEGQVSATTPPARATTLVVVPPPPPPPAALPTENQQLPPVTQAEKPPPRRVTNIVIDDAYLARREAETATAQHAPIAALDDRAPLARRVAAGLIDVVLVAFLSSPFAALIELTNGHWSDPRVAGSLAGIILTIMFLYLTATVAVSGRTAGLKLVSLRAVDARNGLIPTTGQCARRSLVFILSLLTGGLGFLYALVDAEHRAPHDHLSGTMIVRG
ncbi:MAG: RDD family protein [Pyrinomonadaceae bacterium]